MAQFKGTVKWFSDLKGYRFLGREGGEDVFCHYTAIQAKGHKTLTAGDEVEFDVIQGRQGPQADAVVVVKGMSA